MDLKLQNLERTSIFDCDKIRLYTIQHKFVWSIRMDTQYNNNNQIGRVDRNIYLSRDIAQNNFNNC